MKSYFPHSKRWQRNLFHLLIVDDNDDVNWKGFACDMDNENCCSYDGDFEKTIVLTTFDDIDKETQNPLEVNG